MPQGVATQEERVIRQIECEMGNGEKTCLIISGAPFCAHEPVDADFVIACDLGYRHACDLGIVPDLIVGDFDSYRGKLPETIPVISLPVRKDDTDTGYAMRYAVEHGYGRIRVLYALGGKLDHTIANMQSATAAAKRGAQVLLEGADTQVFVFSAGTLRLSVREGQRLSVFALTDECRGVTVSGAQYGLDNATLRNEYPLGVSNAANGEVSITVAEGVLAVFLCGDAA